MKLILKEYKGKKEFYSKFKEDQDLLDYIEEGLITPDNPIIDFNKEYAITLESPNLFLHTWFVEPTFNVKPYPIIQVEYKNKMIFHREGSEGFRGCEIFSDEMFNAIYNRIERDEDPSGIGLKRSLKEAYGESDELNTFIYQLHKRFSSYYEVVLKINGKESSRYFAYEDAALDYYKKLKQEAEEDKDYYDGAIISYNKITLKQEQDEIEFTMIDKENDDFSDEETLNQIFKQNK